MDRNILIIDDSSTIRHGISLVLKQARLFDKYFEVASGQEGLEILEKEMIELVICDIIMPGMDGFEFLMEMKSQDEYHDIPVILLTGQESVEKKIKGLDMGASDYLLKPFDPGELIARVRVQLKVKRLQDALKIAKQRYKELSITDYLTQVYNRRHFMELFEQEFSRATRYGQELSLMLMDLDNFKDINDNHGHLTGDKVLRRLAKLVKSVIRAHDVFARYGGEEFILMLPQTPGQGAMLVAEKIREKLEKYKFDELGRGLVTLSLGVAHIPNEDILDGKDLISAADRALYKAKENGKNRVELMEITEPQDLE